jgi:hypothetical protein
MPKVSKDDAPQITDYGPVYEAKDEVDGYALQLLELRQDMDATPMLKGLPNDRCHAPHWGYVIKGRLTFDCGDHEEVFEAGDAFYLAPGHIPIGNEPGTHYVQFSPAEPLAEVSATIVRNMKAMQEAPAS